MQGIYAVKSSRATLVLILMVAVNLIAAMSVQMLFFTVPGPLTPEALTKRTSYSKAAPSTTS